MSDFAQVFLTVLAPIFGIAACGYTLARLGLVDDSRSLARVSVYIFLPALAFLAMATSDLGRGEFVALVLVAWTLAVVEAVFGWTLARAFAFDPVTQSGFLLSVMTVNAGNFGIPLNQLAFGPESLVRATVYYVATLLVTYVGVVLVTTQRPRSLPRALRTILRMPLIYAAALGLIVNHLGWKIPDPVLHPLRLLSTAAVPSMLTLLGVELARSRLGREGVALSAVLGMRLIAAPVMAMVVAQLLGLEGLTRNVAIVQSSMPTAVGAALMAVEFNAQPSLVSGAVLVTTLGSLVTLTLLLGVLRS